ncbi:FkbM family methyltransferase [Stella humosa]|uniref:FkbM family methyltransferase n=2 Tax=Stella humosa TaxID=94 RepID=A0A3N1MJF4_9PROT|nr:FkbM family methyltransferase [Stella humosa]BBK29632.1 hypothetical protein STHU_02660 [Stella humosa]
MRASLMEKAPSLFALLVEAKARFLPDHGEPELRFVPALCHSRELALDVGANHGTYACAMVRHASRTIAAEPNPELARVLRRRLDAAIRAGRATVLEAAISDGEGSIPLFVPTGQPGLASVEGHAAGGGRTVTVARRPIDSLDLPRTGFIKIDVEGHELAVIEGARGLLARDRPNLLIEAEDRHRPGALAAIRAILDPLGYRGFFLLDGRLEPIARFDQRIHQDRAALNEAGSHRLPGRTYINNFIFTARDDAIRALAAAAPGGLAG